MTRDDVLEFIAQNPACALATCDGGQARARGFLTNLIDGKIWFTTGASKRVCGQLEANRLVELCYFAPDYQRMLRVTARVRFADDRQVKERLIAMRDYLKGFSPDDPEFKLFTLEEAEAVFWTLADNMNEAQLPRISL